MRDMVSFRTFEVERGTRLIPVPTDKQCETISHNELCRILRNAQNHQCCRCATSYIVWDYPRGFQFHFEIPGGRRHAHRNTLTDKTDELGFLLILLGAF